MVGCGLWGLSCLRGGHTPSKVKLVKIHAYLPKILTLY